MKNYYILSEYNDMVFHPLIFIMNFIINLISKTHHKYDIEEHHITIF